LKRTLGRPFLEILSSALREDYRFPLLEIFVFLFGVSTFVFSSSIATSSISSSGVTTQSWIYDVANSLLGLPLLILAILVLKNLAYGLGTDIENGTIQTLLSYPMRRRLLLTAKLLSGIVVPLAIFLSIQFTALFVLAPDIVSSQLLIVSLTFAASIAEPLLLASTVLILSLVFKRGGPALIAGIIMFFILQVAQGLSSFFVSSTGSPLAMKIISLLSPTIAVRALFGATVGIASSVQWHPSLVEVIGYVASGYSVSFALLAISYWYFSRHFEP